MWTSHALPVPQFTHLTLPAVFSMEGKGRYLKLEKAGRRSPSTPDWISALRRGRRLCAQHTAQESSSLGRPRGPGRDPRGRHWSRGPGGYSGGCTRWAPLSRDPQPLLTPEACFQRTQTPNFGLRVTPEKWPDTQRWAGPSPGVPGPHIHRASPGWSQGASNWGLDTARAQGVPLSL